MTERQLANDALPADTRLIIVPGVTYAADETLQQLRATAAQGTMVGIIGQSSLRMNPVGRKRAEASIAGAKAIDLGAPQDYQPQLSCWLDAAEIPRELLAIDEDGNPAWGIEVRTARLGDRRLVYFINLMRTSITVQLRWKAADAHLRDLQTNKVVSSPLTLEPRQVILGEY